MDSVSIPSIHSGNVTTKGIQVPMGMSKTIDVVMFSDGPTADYSVLAVDAGLFKGHLPELSFAWDAPAGHNGDTLHLTITRLTGGTGSGTEFVIGVQNGQSLPALWWGFAAD
jgi:hypothetical protein